MIEKTVMNNWAIKLQNEAGNGCDIFEKPFSFIRMI